jgi:hypothetical protein
MDASGNLTKTATSSDRHNNVGAQEDTNQGHDPLRLLYVHVSPAQSKQKETGMLDTSR